MNKINILITKRGRDNYLKLVLHNFNLANNLDNYDVQFYIGEDDKQNIGKIDYSAYKNIKVEHLYTPNLPEAGELFCRGHILNQLLQTMRQDYDFISIADTDMVYQKNFFDELSNILIDRNNTQQVVIAKGVYSHTEGSHKEILEHKHDCDFIMKNYPYSNFATNSQVAFTKAYHEKIKQVLTVDSIFDTQSFGHDFIGYGMEDTLVKRIIQSSKTNVVLLKNAWVHVWHEKQEIIPANQQRNKKVGEIIQKEIVKRLKANKYYSNRHIKKLVALINR